MQCGERVTKDISNDAKHIAEIVKAVGPGNITLKQCTGIQFIFFFLLFWIYYFWASKYIFMGSAAKALAEKGFTDVPAYGKGKDWNKADVERLSHLLVIEEVLAEEVRTGFKNNQIAYIKVLLPFSWLYAYKLTID